MAEATRRERLGITPEMIEAFGPIIFDLSLNVQDRCGDPVRRLDFAEVERQRAAAGLADHEIAAQLGLAADQVTFIRVLLEQRRFKPERYYRLFQLGGGRRFRTERDMERDRYTLIDAGFPNKQVAVFEAIRGLARSPDQLKHLVFTHGHPDHIGSAAAIVRETGARTYMHPLDIPLAENGGPFRPMTPAPGLLRQVMCRLFFHPNERLEPIAIDQPLIDEEILPIAGGIEVIHVPGHCAGQVALLWHPGRMLFAADVCMNLMGLADPVGFENLEEGRASQRKLAGLSFDAAGFGHGKRIARDASAHFRTKWGNDSSASRATTLRPAA